MTKPGGPETLPTVDGAGFALLTLGETRLSAGDPSSCPGASLLPPGKALALLAYLHCALRRTATREHLMDQFWQHTSPDAARQSLRQTVYRLRSALGGHAIESQGDTLTLGLDLVSDRDRFLTAVHEGRLVEAIACYGGDFFPGFAAPGAVGFEQWVDLERERLRVAYVCAAEAAIGQALGRADAREALRLAARVRERCPSSQIAWRLHMEVLMASNDRIQAVIEAEALEARLRQEDLVPDLETRSLIQRVRALPIEAASRSPDRPRPDLVGRETIFLALIENWKQVITGRGRTTVLRGTAGIGKTRLLQEFHQRMVGLGARALMLRARPADRQLPFALAATLAEALATLPGAMGVSTATAAILVDLAPSLSGVYRGATRESRDPDELQRARTLALAELLQCAAEDSPLAVLIDDLHWADSPSRQLLSSLSERLADLPVLLVISHRPLRGDWSPPPTARIHELEPLSSSQLEAMVASMASCEATLCTTLGVLLGSASGGTPLLALVALELALEQGLLEIRDSEWTCTDLERLQVVMAGGQVLDQLLSQLPPGGSTVLLAISMAGCPLRGSVLAATIGGLDWTDLFGALEQRGLLVQTGNAWEIGHDTIADAVISTSPVETQAEVAGMAGRALLGEAGDSANGLQLAGRLLMRAKPEDGVACFRRWLHASKRRRYWRDPTSAAAKFLGESSTSPGAAYLGARISRFTRLARGYPKAAAAASLLVVLAGLVVASRGLEHWLAAPAQSMVINGPQTSEGFLFQPQDEEFEDPFDGRNPLPVFVDFRDNGGALTLRAPDSVEVLLNESGNHWLEGTLTQPVRQGRAVFSDLQLRGAGPFQLEFRSAGLPPARSPVLFAGNSDLYFEFQSHRVLGGEINGQAVDSVQRVVRLLPGELLTGRLHFRTFTAAPTAAQLAGAIALWGDRRTNFIALAALPPHGDTEWEMELKDPGTGRVLQAPRTPGRYWLVLLVEVETEMKYVASRTNWALGEPKWFDGDDVFDLPPAQLRELDSVGIVSWPRTLVDKARPGQSITNPDGFLVGTLIQIIVAAP